MPLYRLFKRHFVDIVKDFNQINKIFNCHTDIKYVVGGQVTTLYNNTSFL